MASGLDLGGLEPTTLLDAVAPLPPDFSFNFEALATEFSWLTRLRGCPQDPIHHSEGDVFVHTQRVCEALTSLAGFSEGARESQTTLFWAALLHDVAKPDTTRVESNGRVTARGHARRGAVLARRILWELDFPMPVREAICGLVRHHLVPFHLITNDRAEWRAHRISQLVSCADLAVLAEADARGRDCADQNELLDNIALFEELCREADCLDEPRPFPSDHARVLYFREHGRNPTYAPWEDFSCEVTLLSGLPGAGKDTYLREVAPHLPVVSLDTLRRALNISPTKPQGRVVAAARELARTHLRAGRDFAWNATNLSRDHRDRVISLLLAYGARVRLVYIEATSSALFARNRTRGDEALPVAALERLLRRWEIPRADEAHEVVWIDSRSRGLRTVWHRGAALKDLD